MVHLICPLLWESNLESGRMNTDMNEAHLGKTPFSSPSTAEPVTSYSTSREFGSTEARTVIEAWRIEYNNLLPGDGPELPVPNTWSDVVPQNLRVLAGGPIGFGRLRRQPFVRDCVEGLDPGATDSPSFDLLGLLFTLTSLGSFVGTKAIEAPVKLLPVPVALLVTKPDLVVVGAVRSGSVS
jgi:hypothetical protein